MVDTHYDLLSICYTCYIKNDYTKIKNIANKILANKDKIKCIFANLYFMSITEMKEELGEKYYTGEVSILEMFKISKRILNKFLPNMDFIYSIEGCDYLNISDLDDLYKEGLRSIILVWNNENKYGSGNRTDKGLTKEGKDFLNRAIDLNIGIDLSHANQNTFFDMINVIKERQKEKEVICYASHSNAKKLCDRNRNLTLDEIEAIKSVNGVIGVFSNRNFVTLDKTLNKEKQELEYLKHIIYISNIIGIENVMLSTDDMSFYSDMDSEYLEFPIFDYSEISSKVKKLLLKYFDINDTNKIMFENAYKNIINKLNKNNILNEVSHETNSRYSGKNR